MTTDPTYLGRMYGQLADGLAQATEAARAISAELLEREPASPPAPAATPSAPAPAEGPADVPAVVPAADPPPAPPEPAAARAAAVPRSETFLAVMRAAIALSETSTDGWLQTKDIAAAAGRSPADTAARLKTTAAIGEPVTVDGRRVLLVHNGRLSRASRYGIQPVAPAPADVPAEPAPTPPEEPVQGPSAPEAAPTPTPAAPKPEKPPARRALRPPPAMTPGAGAEVRVGPPGPAHRRREVAVPAVKRAGSVRPPVQSAADNRSARVLNALARRHSTTDELAEALDMEPRVVAFELRRLLGQREIARHGSRGDAPVWRAL